MKKKIRSIEEYIEYGEYTLVIVMYSTPKEAREFINLTYRADLEELPDNLLGFVKFEGNYIFLGLMYSFTIQDLVHELMHITHGALFDMGIPLTDHTEETYARYIDMLTTKTIKMLKSSNIKLPIL